MTRAGHFLPFLQDRDHSNCQYLSVSCRFPTCRMMTFLLLSHLLQRPWESNVRQSSFNDCAQSLSRVRLFGAPWTAAHQAPLSMEFFRQEYWSGCHFLLQGIFPTQGSDPHLQCLLHSQADSLPLSHLGKYVHLNKGILQNRGRMMVFLKSVFQFFWLYGWPVGSIIFQLSVQLGVAMELKAPEMRWVQLSFYSLYKKTAYLWCPYFLLSLSWYTEKVATSFDLTDDDSAQVIAKRQDSRDLGIRKTVWRTVSPPGWTSHLQPILWWGNSLLILFKSLNFRIVVSLLLSFATTKKNGVCNNKQKWSVMVYILVI